MDELKYYLGKGIAVGSCVVYFRLGDTSPTSVKKYIWEVTEILRDKAVLANLKDGSRFTTDANNLVNMMYVPNSHKTEEFFNSDCLATYRRWAGYSLRYGSGTNHPDIFNAAVEYEFKDILPGSWEEKSAVSIDELTGLVADNFNKRKVNKMTRVTDKVVKRNSDAVKSAAALTAGKTLNRVVREKVTPMLPFMVRSYADTAVGEIVIANLVSFIVDTYAPSNENARIAADAMMNASMVNMFDGFNLDQAISDVLGSVDLTALKDSADMGKENLSAVK